MIRRLGQFLRRRPLLASFLGLLLLAGAGAGGFYAYAQREWRLAHTAFAEERPDDARRHLHACRRAWPRDQRTLILSARAARLTGDFTEAESLLNQCLRLAGGASADVQLEFLLMRVQRGEVDEVAPTLYLCAEQGHPDAAIIFETVTLAYIRNFRYGPTLECLQRWFSQEPDAAGPHRWRGLVREQMKNFSGAISDYRRALEINPALIPVRLRLADLLLADNMPLDAIPHLERLRTEAPDRPEVLVRLGQCHFLQGDLAEARQHLEAARDRLPDDPVLRITLAKLDLHEGRAAEAEAHVRHVLRSDPADVEARHTLVAVLQSLGRPAEAAEALRQNERQHVQLRRATELLRQESERPSPDPAPAHEVGALFVELAQDRLAEYWLHEALKRESDYAPAHRSLAEFYEKKGDPEKARPHRRRLAELGTNRPQP